jgi:hypothetical protein
MKKIAVWHDGKFWVAKAMNSMITVNFIKGGF